MKFKAAITKGTPQAVIDAFGSSRFATACLQDICQILGVAGPSARPAEFYVQHPDITIAVKEAAYGVELRVTGVSRSGREHKDFHKALEALETLLVDTTVSALKAADSVVKVQVFGVLMLDGDVEVAPGSREYSSVLETAAKWVNRYGIVD